jgi:hypothetical protein
MAAQHLTDISPSAFPQLDPARQFQRLCDRRDLAAYRVAGAVLTVISFWECESHDDRRKVRPFEEVLRRRLCEMAATYMRYGDRRLTVLLRRQGVGR